MEFVYKKNILDKVSLGFIGMPRAKRLSVDKILLSIDEFNELESIFDNSLASIEYDNCLKSIIHDSNGIYYIFLSHIKNGVKYYSFNGLPIKINIGIND